MLDLRRPDHAYLYGFLLGDGSLSNGRGRKGRLSIEVAERDADLLALLAPLLPGGLLRTRTRRTNFSDCSRTATLSWCRYDVRQAVIDCGMPVGRKDRLVAPPSSLYDRRAFARGFFDADGSIGFTGPGVPFLSLVTKSPIMAAWWTEVLSDVARVERTCRPNARDGVANIMVQADAAIVMARYLYQPGDLALRRKQLVAQDVSSWARPATMRRVQRRRSWSPAEDARVVADVPVAALALELDRTVKSVAARRWRLRQGLVVPTRPSHEQQRA